MWIYNPYVIEPKHFIRLAPTPACGYFSFMRKHGIGHDPVKTSCLETPIDDWTDGSGERFHLCPDHLWEVQLAVMFGCTSD